MEEKRRVRNWHTISKYKTQNPYCEFCGKEVEEVHHIKPVVEGGTNDSSNLISLCKHCHRIIHRRITPVGRLISLGRCQRRELDADTQKIIQTYEEHRRELVKMLEESIEQTTKAQRIAEDYRDLYLSCKNEAYDTMKWVNSVLDGLNKSMRGVEQRARL